nr:retrotransposon protein, putative, Ty1-copia subclass [Tanacetum cinerariifolium]
MLQDVKSYLGRSFAMKDLGKVAYILGIKIYRDRSKRLIGLCQKAYIEKILKRFYMENFKRETIPMQKKLKLSKSQGASTPAEIQRMKNIPYASAVGSIMYAVRCTRPDVAFAQNMTSRNMERELRVSCYTDAGYLTDADNLKSQTGYVFVLNGGAVDWKSTKQSIFATSSTDVEYIAAFDASNEAVWIRKFISGLDIVPTIEEPISMYCDNTRAIVIAKDDGVTKGTRPDLAYAVSRLSIDLGGCQTSGTWAKIVGTINHLHSSGIVPLNSILFKVGDGSFIRFWKDTWLGNDPLYIIYNRLFHFENNKDCFISQRILNGSWEWDWCRPITMGRSKTEFDNLIIDISNMEIDELVESNTCVWSFSNDDSFSVNSVRKHIDEHSLTSLFSCTRWYKMIPKKVNVFMWRMLLDRLPNRLYLSSRGLDIDSISFMVCNEHVESNDHVFFTCDTAVAIWNLVRSWIDLPLPSFLSCED